MAGDWIIKMNKTDPTDDEVRLYIIQHIAATQDMYYNLDSLISAVMHKATHHGYPTDNFYKIRLVSATNAQIWGLMIDKILIPYNRNEHRSPLMLDEFHLSALGASLFRSGLGEQEVVSFHDPGSYIAYIKREISDLDPTIEQYIGEALGCMRQNLQFATAVMLGAAAERAILSLFQTMILSAQDPNIQKWAKLLEDPKMPTIFREIDASINFLVKNKLLEYQIANGMERHMLSLQELIRQHRNSAVHPAMGQIDISKNRLILAGFPAAMIVIYRLLNWFNEKKGQLPLPCS